MEMLAVITEIPIVSMETLTVDTEMLDVITETPIVSMEMPTVDTEIPIVSIEMPAFDIEIPNIYKNTYDLEKNYASSISPFTFSLFTL